LPLTLFSLTGVLMLVFSFLAIRVSAIYYILAGGLMGVCSYLLTFVRAKGDKCQDGTGKGGRS
jgi:hypothetical protein